jgi:DNA-binding transcriptional LysR family regulator
VLLQHLVTFCRVVEEGSFTKAAQVQNMTQPSVTKQVGALEDHLGVQLFTRAAKQVRLTPAGQLVYDYARQILQLVDRCERAVDELKLPGSGHVTVGCVHTIGLFTLPDLLAEFAREWPNVRINVRTGTIDETVAMVLHGEVDVGLITSPALHERLESRPLFEDPLVVVASPEFAARLPDQLTLSDLAQQPLIAFVRGSRFRVATDQLLEQVGIQSNALMEFDTHEGIKTMVSLGFGIAIAPHSTVVKDLVSGALVALKVPDLPPSSRTASLIVRRDEVRPPAVAAFLDLLERHFPSRKPAVS